MTTTKIVREGNKIVNLLNFQPEPVKLTGPKVKRLAPPDDNVDVTERDQFFRPWATANGHNKRARQNEGGRGVIHKRKFLF